MPADPTITGYAKALFEIASSEGDIARVSDELFRIARVLEKENDLRQTLTDIAVSQDGKEKLLDDVLGEKVSTHTLNLMKFLVGQGKSRQLVKIADALARLAEVEAKREIAEVRSAVALSEPQQKKLATALGKATGKTVSVKVVIDPSVVGGLIARVGDVVIDGSISGKLQALREHLGVR